jgi:protein SCO1
MIYSNNTSQRFNKPSWLFIFLLVTYLMACSQPEKLPILGEREAVTKQVNGETITDTLYHTIPDFRFVSQHGDTITPAATTGKIYVADFFFTTCPTICPTMKTQLKRVYERFQANPRVLLLSHTIDPAHDSVAVLRTYAEQLGVKKAGNWLFVTGNREQIFDLAQTGYNVSAQADESAPGGAVHSGAFILVDTQRRIRGVYDGTTEKGTEQLMADMETLLAEDVQ